MATRFDLEEAITATWATAEDLSLAIEAVLETPNDPDKLANILIGIRELTKLRNDKVFQIFEALITEGKLQ